MTKITNSTESTAGALALPRLRSALIPFDSIRLLRNGPATYKAKIKRRKRERDGRKRVFPEHIKKPIAN